MGQQPKIVVVGAGLAGISVALELTRRGRRVTLIDQDRLPMQRASRRNEGKIHLGFVYANEPSPRTARLMMQGALAFGPLLRRWLGPAARRVLTPSRPFDYLIHRESVVPPTAFEAHCAAVESLFDAESRRYAEPEYLGERPAWLWRPMRAAALEPRRAGGEIVHGIHTRERAIDTDRLADALATHTLVREELTWLGGTRVHGFTRTAEGFRVEAERDGAALSLPADLVVNATWERRCALDRTLGIEPPADILHRLKYRVIARLPEAWRRAPSMTMVTGPFGDIVIRRDGTAFLSWYPVGRTGWSTQTEPPRAWDRPSRGQPDPAVAAQVSAGILAALDLYYVGIGKAQVLQVDAGPIVALGRSDVDDKRSGLHQRCEVGFTEHDGFFSLDPGKLTTAPLLGSRLAAHIAQRIGRSPADDVYGREALYAEAA